MIDTDESAAGVPALRGLATELWLAAAMLTLWPLAREGSVGSDAKHARAMLFLPIVALMLGVALALADHALAGIAGIFMRSAVVVVLSLVGSKALYPVGIAHAIGSIRAGRRPAFTGLSEVGPLGALAGAGFVLAELFCLASIVTPPARAGAIVLATMLSRWALVPIGYGLKPLERWGLGVPFEGGIRFREFAGASLLALGAALGLYQIVALVAIIPLALAILGLRLLFSRRLGGVSGYALAAGAAACELLIYATLAALRA